MIQAVLTKINDHLLKKHESTLDEIFRLKYVYDSELRKTFLSGKLEAYEDIAIIIKSLIL